MKDDWTRKPGINESLFQFILSSVVCRRLVGLYVIDLSFYGVGLFSFHGYEFADFWSYKIQKFNIEELFDFHML